MTRRFCLALLAGVAAAQIGKPRLGFLVDREGCLRAVEGVTGAFTLGDVLERDVLSADYSGRVLVIKKADQLRIDQRRFEAPAGPATVVFDEAGSPAEIFFPAEGILWTWRDGAFVASPAQDIIADVFVREGELIVKGIPVRVPGSVRKVSHLGESWLAVLSDQGTFAIHDERVYELPEGEEE